MCNFPSVVECRPSGLEWNIHLDSINLFEFTILFINRIIGSWYLNIYSRLLITWRLITWTLRYLGQRNYFSRKVWETIDPALIRRFVKTVILTNIFSWTFVLLCFGKLIEFLITAALRYGQNTRVIKFKVLKIYQVHVAREFAKIVSLLGEVKSLG